MSTATGARHRIQAQRDRVGPVAIIGALLACVVVFGAFFAAGRALSPKPAPREVEPAGLTRVSSGIAIPAALANVPAIELRAPVRHFVTHHVAPATVLPELSTVRAPVEVTPAATVIETPAVSSTPSSSVSSTPSTHHESSGGQSFDSSG